METDVLIVGAGASGLMAGATLAKNGLSVVVLEGRDRIGGRIHTYYDNAQDTYFEFGAEFIHGDLPITFDLLKEADIDYKKTGGRMWQASKDNEYPSADRSMNWELFEQTLKEVEEDMTVASFLNTYFSGDQFASLRKTVKGYAAGYDSADPDRASIIALRNEWQDEHSHQYRPINGYGTLIDHLSAECGMHNCAIHLSSTVKQIHWEQNKVQVMTSDRKTFIAKKVLITVPPAILLANELEIAAIGFSPSIDEKIAAVKMLGYGEVIKILLHFKKAFWKELQNAEYPGSKMSDLGFVLSSEPIPTWWTQYPDDIGLLTGWLGGPEAIKWNALNEGEILNAAIDSLAAIFQTDASDLRKELLSSHIINWTTDPFSKGSYNYTTLDTPKGRKILESPVENTIFFGGEALCKEAEAGTVEAAFESGLLAAKRIIDSF